MRRIGIAIGSILPALIAVGAIAPAAAADSHQSSSESYQQSVYSMNVRETEAFNLVSFAYRGELEDEGIPSYGQFTRDVRSGEITAQHVIDAGIDNGYLSPMAAEDSEYANAVELQLNTFTIGN